MSAELVVEAWIAPGEQGRTCNEETDDGGRGIDDRGCGGPCSEPGRFSEKKRVLRHGQEPEKYTVVERALWLLENPGETGHGARSGAVTGRRGKRFAEHLLRNGQKPEKHPVVERVLSLPALTV